MIKRYIQLIPVLVMLAACGSAPPVPTDSFYRLTLPQDIGKQQIGDSVIHVGNFIGEGLYNERAILYTDDQHGRKIIQHHYHFWITSPPRMLREHMVEFLRESDSAPMVITDSSKGDGLRISGKVLDFEKQTAGDVITANVALELRVDIAGEDLPRLIKQYRLKEPVNGNSMTDVVESFNTAVFKIYSEFTADIRSAL